MFFIESVWFAAMCLAFCSAPCNVWTCLFCLYFLRQWFVCAHCTTGYFIAWYWMAVGNKAAWRDLRTMFQSTWLVSAVVHSFIHSREHKSCVFFFSAKLYKYKWIVRWHKKNATRIMVDLFFLFAIHLMTILRWIYKNLIQLERCKIRHL